jgi:hypothetical protein
MALIPTLANLLGVLICSDALICSDVHSLDAERRAKVGFNKAPIATAVKH